MGWLGFDWTADQEASHVPVRIYNIFLMKEIKIYNADAVLTAPVMGGIS